MTYYNKTLRQGPLPPRWSPLAFRCSYFILEGNLIVSQATIKVPSRDDESSMGLSLMGRSTL